MSAATEEHLAQRRRPRYVVWLAAFVVVLLAAAYTMIYRRLNHPLDSKIDWRVRCLYARPYRKLEKRVIETTGDSKYPLEVAWVDSKVVDDLFGSSAFSVDEFNHWDGISWPPRAVNFSELVSCPSSIQSEGDLVETGVHEVWDFRGSLGTCRRNGVDSVQLDGGLVRCAWPKSDSGVPQKVIQFYVPIEYDGPFREGEVLVFRQVLPDRRVLLVSFEIE